ncbi:E3 ubiquitin-protein ligase RNF103 [Thalassophryne amazonica]|uniref:E3 ubiquitin-protein ligase RNF103 n=1 Tax=Thalassophryne amazonica TaxID=390379 RepID=UPI0014710598|nr:E3 ubiquitin-protein ligase RNF103 [Thalassophryne amazonica]
MWLKVFFLLLYFMLLFVLARFFEVVLWYETGVFGTQLVDPVRLSYTELKTILESRGLSYSGLKKKEVSALLQNSGELTEGELYSAMKEKERVGGGAGGASITHFSGEMHFYELVEDTKDGMWLVQVIAQDRDAPLTQTKWGKMVQKLSQFGIRSGTLNCSNDHRSCIKRGWQRSTMIMSVPQTSASKGKVMLKEYNGCCIETEHIFHWMTSHVAHRIKTVHRFDQLLAEWHSDLAHPLKMFLFARLSQPPAFFSSLSVKFTGRIEFVFVDVRRWDNHSNLSQIGIPHSPAYILKTPEGIYHYGNSTGEFLSLAAMDTFLRSIQPEVNDVFVLSLVLINLLAWMDLFITQGATVKRFVVLIRTLGTYNSIMLVSWLPVLAALQLPYLNSLCGYSLKLLRYADTTALASLVRADWTFYASHPGLLLSTYLVHGLLIDYFEKKRRCAVQSQEDNTTNLEWLASLWDWYTSYLLHPIASLQQIPSDLSDWEEDPSFLFERLAFPDLWLHPLVNLDYIRALPTWTFRAAVDHREEVEEETDRSQFVTNPDCPLCPSQRSKRRVPNQKSRKTQQRLSSAQPCACSSMTVASDGCGCSCDTARCRHGDRTPPSASSCHSPEGLPTHQRCDWSVWPASILHCSECVVCLENFVSDELLMGLSCGHAFHQQCIMVWLVAGRHCCPVCRWPSYKKKHQRHLQSSPPENHLQD